MKLVASLIIVTSIAVLCSSPAIAGWGKGGKKAAPTSATCNVTPNPASLGQLYTVNGTGFEANVYVSIWVYDPIGVGVFMGLTDANGDFSAGSYAGNIGHYHVDVHAVDPRSPSNNVKEPILASCEFDVN